MNRLRSVCETYADLALEGIPDDVIHLAGLQVANMLAAGMAGHDHGIGEATRGHRRNNDGPFFAFGSGVSDPSTACFVNAAASMSHDFDDYLYMGHTGHSAVFGALAACQDTGRSLETLLKAVIAANEIEGRLGGSTALGPHNGQMWAFIHRAGTAAAAAVARDLNPEAFCQAVALSLYAPPHPDLAGFMGGDAKYLTAATPAAEGLRLAELAEDGMRGNPNVYEAEDGFLDNYAYLPLPEVMDGAGETWVTRSLAFKPNPGCAYLQAPIDLMTDLLAEEGFGTEDVDSITVDVSLLTLLMEQHSKPHQSNGRLAPVTVTFSVPLSLAIVLREGELSPSHLNDDYLRKHRGDLRELGEHVTLRHSWERTASTLEGINGGIDLNPLLAEKGWTRTLGALRRMNDEHEGPSTVREGLRLVTSGNVGRLRGALRSPLDWDEFDFSQARMDGVKFHFGCELTVTLSDGREFRRSSLAHPGAGHDSRREQERLVERKLNRAGGDYFPDEGHTDPLMDLLRTPEDEHTRDLLELLRT